MEDRCYLTLTLFSWSIDLKFHLVFVVRSIYPLPYSLGSPYLVHILITMGTFEPGMCQLTLTSFSWPTDLFKFTPGFRELVSFSIAIQPRYVILVLTLNIRVHTHIYAYVALISVSWFNDLVNCLR